MYVFYVFLCKELLVTLSYFPLDYTIGSILDSSGPGHVEYYINLTLQDIHKWWECKIENYIKNYTRRNNLSLVEA
jgi:hypothetical protein